MSNVASDVEADRLEEGHAVHRVGHPRDDAAQPAARRREPVAGISGLSGARRSSRRRRAPRFSADVNQYAVTWGARAACARRSPREFTRRYGLPVDARRAGDGLLRRDRGDDGDDDGDHRSGRRGRRLRAVLRELRAGRDPVRRDAALRHAAPTRTAGADWTLRPRRAGGRVQQPNEGDHPQHAEQPDRQGVHARRARGDRGALPQVGRDRDLRRDLRAHHLRRRAARADRVARRHGGAHGDDQQPVEDVQRDRLAGRAGRSRRRR